MTRRLAIPVLLLLATSRPAAGFCPSYTLGSPWNPFPCGIAAVPGTNPSVAEWNAIFLRASGGPAAWGDAGPTVPLLTEGCGKLLAPTPAEPLFPCELLQAIAMQESSWRQFCAPDQPPDQAGRPSQTIISFDCGYGAMQITSGMRIGDSASWDRARVASDPFYNAATGGLFLRTKWQETACVGDRRLRVVEHWYLATWAYNGLTYSNNPNNPSFSTARPPYDPGIGGAYPYQEKVWGWMEHPPSAAHWTALAPAYPDRADIGNTTSPPPLPEPGCAGPTDCTNRRPPHLSTCLPPPDPSATLFVPVVLSVAGARGSFFTTELALTNRGSTTAKVVLSYVATAGGGTGSASITLAAGRQQIVPDAISWLRDLGLPIPGSGNRLGTLRVRFEQLSAPGVAAVTARTTTAAANGRAGLAYPAVPSVALLRESALLFGLRENDTDRSNIAFANGGDAASGDVTLRVTLVSGDPSRPGSVALPDVTLPPGGFAQLSSVLAGTGFSQGYARVERVAGRASWYAYAVVNDNANSDGSFVPPHVEEASSEPVLPALVEAGTFRSELVVANRTPSAAKPRFTWIAGGLSGGAVSFDLPLLPGEQQLLPSAVQLLRDRGVAGIPAQGSTGLAGALFSSGAEGLFVAARTAAPGGGGLFGTFYAALPPSALALSDAWLYGLRQDAENRSNVALVHAGADSDGPLTFALEIHDGETGRLVATVAVAPLAPRRFLQLNALLATHAPGVTNGYVRVVRVSGTAPFVAYAVVNDGAAPGERTGDGAYVPMAR